MLVRHDPQAPNVYLQLSAPCPRAGQPSGPNSPSTASSASASKSLRAAQASVGKPAGPKPGPGSWEREYRDLETAIKLRNYSGRTLEAYRFWVARFQAFVRSRPTAQLSNQEVRGFLSSLAIQHDASASSQNQAFNALLFFFRQVLHRDFGSIDGVVRAKRHRYIPVVLSRAEVDAILTNLQPPYRLVVTLLYGCGLRLAECVNLRVCQPRSSRWKFRPRPPSSLGHK